MKLMAKEEKHNTLLDSQKDDIEFWKEQEEKFVDTQVVNVFSKLLESEQSVLMVGEPGIGKSMLLHNVALKLQKTIDYNIIPCTGIHDILQHHEKDKRQMFVLDDICGTLTVSMSAIEQWINNEDKLKRILKKGCTKIAAACRLDIYKDAKFQESFTIFESNIFNLSVLYSREDKLTICKNYLSDTNIQLLKSTNVEFTPLMCYLYHVYSKNKKFNLTEFLHCPFEKYTEEWNKLKGLDSYKYCSLFLLVIYNGIIKESLFEMFNENNTKSKSVLKYIFETCGIDRGTSRGRIKTVLDSMIGTYVMKSRSEYKVIHDQMFDFMCCYFGNKDTMVRCFIRFSDIRVFNERTQLQSVNEQYGKFTIMISKEHEKEYFERITKDVKLGKMNQCFYNTQMKYEVYRTLFLKILESIDEKILIAQLYQRKKPSLNLTYGYDSIETSKYQDYSDDDDEKYLIEGPFIISCLQGYHDIFQYFLSKKVDIENCYLIHTPLTAACKGGNEQIVQILVKRGCDVHQVDGMRQTPLTTACGADNVKIVQLLIDKGSDVNQFDCEGETPLAAACKRGNETIVQLLIEKGSKVNEVDGTRLTLLTAACEGGNEHIVEILLKKGCDVDQVDGMRQTPLITACKRRNETIVQLLIEKGSKVNQVGGTRLTPLTAACDKQNEQIVQLLTEKGCDVNQVDYIEQVPLLTACNERNEQLVQLLIDKGSEINLANGMGQTPLTTACSTGNVRLVQFLIKKGSNIEQVDGIGQTPLTIACKDGNQELVELLIDEKCEINRVDGLGQTPLIAACRKGNKNIVQLLINKGSDENQVDRIGQTPLTIACNEGNEKIVQLLLDKGSDVNQIVRKLKTPLSAACNIGKVSDVNQVDGMWLTPLTAA
ncbi:uncharacterized protein LOC143083101 isoform X1 [Mytilus galloprovincialis]|uniref:uncharacterized protein LOC143083101 isoform X1 n=2 Tax=Mytilus galloprovincialis TaxID=29158 RepID=UPI003F7B4FFC